MSNTVDFKLAELLHASIKHEALQTLNSLFFPSNIFTSQVSVTYDLLQERTINSRSKLKKKIELNM